MLPVALVACRRGAAAGTVAGGSDDGGARGAGVRRGGAAATVGPVHRRRLRRAPRRLAAAIGDASRTAEDAAPRANALVGAAAKADIVSPWNAAGLPVRRRRRASRACAAAWRHRPGASSMTAHTIELVGQHRRRRAMQVGHALVGRHVASGVAHVRWRVHRRADLSLGRSARNRANVGVCGPWALHVPDISQVGPGHVLFLAGAVGAAPTGTSECRGEEGDDAEAWQLPRCARSLTSGGQRFAPPRLTAGLEPISSWRAP
mmetsp:Transcript_124335/g.357293  ORF Transcript_124335/g.357293 Transcript_124335/m.357293 type:complete len:261 (+) Transcript_124335:717-1499(+)